LRHARHLSQDARCPNTGQPQRSVNQYDTPNQQPESSFRNYSDYRISDIVTVHLELVAAEQLLRRVAALVEGERFPRHHLPGRDDHKVSAQITFVFSLANKNTLSFSLTNSPKYFVYASLALPKSGGKSAAHTVDMNESALKTDYHIFARV
jgi:hypothetical protein